MGLDEVMKKLDASIKVKCNCGAEEEIAKIFTEETKELTRAQISEAFIIAAVIEHAFFAKVFRKTIHDILSKTIKLLYMKEDAEFAERMVEEGKK